MWHVLELIRDCHYISTLRSFWSVSWQSCCAMHVTRGTSATHTSHQIRDGNTGGERSTESGMNRVNVPQIHYVDCPLLITTQFDLHHVGATMVPSSITRNFNQRLIRSTEIQIWASEVIKCEDLKSNLLWLLNELRRGWIFTGPQEPRVTKLKCDDVSNIFWNTRAIQSQYLQCSCRSQWPSETTSIT